jgi:hypothetical protein
MYIGTDHLLYKVNAMYIGTDHLLYKVNAMYIGTDVFVTVCVVRFPNILFIFSLTFRITICQIVASILLSYIASSSLLGGVFCLTNNICGLCILMTAT